MSPFAERFHTQARPLLWAQLAETALLRDHTGDHDLRVVFRRADPTTREAEGPAGFHADAWVEVLVADLPAPDGTSLLIRDDVTWAIRHIERQDSWTWKLHLAQPTDDLRLPDRVR